MGISKTVDTIKSKAIQCYLGVHRFAPNYDNSEIHELVPGFFNSPINAYTHIDTMEIISKPKATTDDTYKTFKGHR